MGAGGDPGGAFDQRPGLFEATRGVAPRRPCIHAVGRRAPEGWRVALLRGGVVLAELEAGEAMALAIEISHAAGVVTMAGFAGDEDGG